MKNTNNKGFSLVELLVAMAIIAVLISIAAFGIQIVQRNARNTKRRKVVEDMQLLAADIQTNDFTYPNSLENSPEGFQFEDGGGAELGMEYPLKGFSEWSRPLVNCSDIGIEEDANFIQLCYDGTKLEIGVRLEGTNNGYVTDI